MLDTLIAVDANSIGYAETAARTLVYGGRETQAVFGFIQKMRALAVGHPLSETLVLWDGPENWRHKIYPGYKGHRDDDPHICALRESYKAQRPLIKEAVCALGIDQYQAKRHEADDLAGILVNTYKDEKQILLISGDQDWLQLIGPTVNWWDMRKRERYVTAKNFTEYTGYENQVAFLQGKALLGDVSDNIVGVDQVGPARAKEILKKFGSVAKYWDAVDSGIFVPKYKWQRNLAAKEARILVAQNVRLMQLFKVEPPADGEVKVTRGKFDPDRFEILCMELGFMSIVNDLDEFLAPFLQEKQYVSTY